MYQSMQLTGCSSRWPGAAVQLQPGRRGASGALERPAPQEIASGVAHRREQRDRSRGGPEPTKAREGDLVGVDREGRDGDPWLRGGAVGHEAAVAHAHGEGPARDLDHAAAALRRIGARGLPRGGDGDVRGHIRAWRVRAPGVRGRVDRRVGRGDRMLARPASRRSLPGLSAGVHAVSAHSARSSLERPATMWLPRVQERGASLHRGRGVVATGRVGANDPGP